MPIWRWRMRPSRTCPPENCNAVRQATGAHGADRRAPAARAARLRDREALADGVLSASSSADAYRRARDHRADGGRGRARPLGILEVFRSVAARGAFMESQTRTSRVLRAAPQSAEADQATRPDTLAPTAAGAGAAESHVGARLHDRRDLQWPALSRAHDHRRGQSRRPGHRSRDVDSQSARGPRAR